jgi:hypothetical protein
MEKSSCVMTGRERSDLRASFLAALNPYHSNPIKADKTCLSIQGTPFPVRNETR